MFGEGGGGGRDMHISVIMQPPTLHKVKGIASLVTFDLFLFLSFTLSLSLPPSVLSRVVWECRVVTFEMGKKLAQQWSITFMESSAKQNEVTSMLMHHDIDTPLCV